MRYIVFYSLLITSLIFSHGCSRLYNAYENEEVIQPTLHEELFVFTVTEILDGESIKVHTTGKDFQVVLSGIKIPTPECIKKEKIERIESLILGKKVALESAANTDIGSEIISRYLWLPDGTMLNEQLLQEGFVRIDPEMVEMKYKDRLSLAENSAIENNLGVWGICK